MWYTRIGALVPYAAYLFSSINPNDDDSLQAVLPQFWVQYFTDVMVTVKCVLQ